MNFTARDIRHLRIEQSSEGPQNPALGLSTQSQKNEIMTRKNGINNLRNYRVVVANDAGENRAWATQSGGQVFAHFIFHTTRAQALFGEGTLAQVAECPRETH